MKRYCLALDLKDDPILIAKYDEYHKFVWPEVIQSLTDSGIESMEIYRISNRLFMIVEVDENFSFDAKAKADAVNERVQEWERIMFEYQQAIPMKNGGNGKGWTRWQLMERVFCLEEYKK